MTKFPPAVAAIPHSLGYRKLVSLLDKKIQTEKITTKEGLGQAIDGYLDNPEYLFPLRCLMKRLAHSGYNGLVSSSILNSTEEIDGQLKQGYYTHNYREYSLC